MGRSGTRSPSKRADLPRRVAGRSLLIVILGPTGSGKSELAANVACRIGGEVLNCDSMQMIRHLEIGTAKPSRELLGLVPHHLFDLIEPEEYYSAGRYMEEARAVCRDVARRNRVPVVVGGTGLYLRALLEGVFTGPGRSEQLRARLKAISERTGTTYLHRFLERRDPEAAAKIAPGDLIRIIRALEVYLLSGSPFSQARLRRNRLRSFSILKIGLNLPRQMLYDRINRRTERMYHSGLIEEVETLLNRGVPPDCKGFEALGYRHAIAVVRQKVSREEAVRLTQRDTRRYAKRQLTWFRKEEGVCWFETSGEDPGTLAQVLAKVKEASEGRI